MKTKGDFRAGGMKTALCLLHCLLGAAALAAGPRIPLIVFDTDIGGDFDDVGAMAVLHALADKGECEILATVSSTLSRDAAPNIEIVNNYYGRTFLPVGAPADWPEKERPCGDFWHEVKWPEVLKAKYPYFRYRTTSEAPDALKVYRRALASAPDSSVTVCAVGTYGNLARLLDTKPDFISPLGGRDLVARKVARLVVMGCEFPSGRECNVKNDVKSAKRVFGGDWPTPVACAGYEIGNELLTGTRVRSMPDNGNPIRDTYRTALGKSAKGRQSWDQTAVLFAVRGEGEEFGVEKGTVTIADDGSNTWRTDPAGPHMRLVARMRPLNLAHLVEDLMCTPPARIRREKRRKAIAPVDAGELRLRPTFSSCGVAWGSPKDVPGLRLECRALPSGEWKAAPRFPYYEETKDFRGSILDLAEDSDYEVRLSADGRKLATGRFRTWRSDVPVARTVLVDPSAAKFPIVVADKGGPDGWIRYTLPPGATLVNDTAAQTFSVEGAAFVLLDDMRIVGGKGRHVVKISSSRAVRVRNCDISGWGRVGEPRYDRLGRRHERGKDNGYGINFDGAIHISRHASEVVVERCWVHDPLGHANSWFYSHPAGPEAVTVDTPDHSTVIRWNDFVGSDLHRFNDAVESQGNFSECGGLNRDADVYGNFMALCNDDCIELDGGQQNVRCFDNRFESALCGVSIQGCMASPVYVFRNQFSGMCDEFGLTGQTIKTGGGAHGDEARAYLWDNMLWGGGNGITMRRLLRADVRGNVLCGRQAGREAECSPCSVVTGNTFGVSMPEERLDPAVPARPLPFILSQARFSGLSVAGGRAKDGERKFLAKWTGGPDARPVQFEVRQNADFDWFEVSPAKGTLSPGADVEFSIRLKPERMADRRFYRGAFLVRAPNGLSRAASIFAETDFVPPFKAEKQGETAIYADISSPVSGSAKSGDATFAFDVKKEGRYYFMIHGGDGHPHLKVSVDGAASGTSKQQTRHYPTWTMLAPGKSFGDMTKFYDLKPGRHTVRIKGRYAYDGLVLTDSPGSFEPR